MARGQPRGAESYGIISRFLDGEHMAYALGDAVQCVWGMRVSGVSAVIWCFLRPDILVI